MKNKTSITMILVLTLLNPLNAIAHSGKTDSSGGHKDNQNKSGLGSYHYHCGGYPAHLHVNGVCPYSSSNASSSSSSGSRSSSVSSSSSESESQKKPDDAPAYQEKSKNIRIFIEGIELACDVPPKIIGERTLIPMRAIFEALDASIDWDGETNQITGRRNDTQIELVVGNSTAIVNGEPVDLDVPVQIVDGRTLVPVRFVAESLNCHVEWDDVDHDIYIWED